MRVAFYAPMKAPDHPVPSGDRQLARMLLRALQARHDVAIASRLRSFDARGDDRRQMRLAAVAARLAERLVARYRREPAARPQAWFTYHVYHKAPDLLGPGVSRALDIPYVVAEASVAPKERCGRWARGYAHAHAAIRGADAVVCVNPVDLAAVREARQPGASTELLPPFVDASSFAAHARERSEDVQPASMRLVTVAMMRAGAKLASYRVLAQALSRLLHLPWELVVVGDGPARGEVEAALAGVAPRVRLVGAQSDAAVAQWLARSDLFVWPAVDEAFGMVFLEAQACGLPVIGGASGGVAAVVAAQRSGLLVPAGDAAAFAAAIERLLLDPSLRTRMAGEALAYVRECHDLSGAVDRLDTLLQRVVAGRARPDARSVTERPC